MFYTELDPYTLKEVYVPKSENEKAMQRALLQYFIPENKPLVIKALIKAGRRDLIGNDKKCLVTPMAGQTQGGYSKQNNNRNSQNQKGRGRAQWFSCTGFQKKQYFLWIMWNRQIVCSRAVCFQIDVECMFVLLISEVHKQPGLACLAKPLED